MRLGRNVLLGAIAAVLIVAALGTWLTTRDDDPTPTSGSAGAASPATADYSSPTIVSEAELVAFGGARGPAYWVGPREDTQLELTQLASGSVFVRYLTGDAEAGDSRSEFISVATYAQSGGYEDLLQASRQDGATSDTSQTGALIVNTKDAPNSTYFSFEDADFQVEVFSPEKGAAKEFVNSGTVTLIQ